MDNSFDNDLNEFMEMNNEEIIYTDMPALIPIDDVTQTVQIYPHDLSSNNSDSTQSSLQEINLQIPQFPLNQQQRGVDTVQRYQPSTRRQSGFRRSQEDDLYRAPELIASLHRQARPERDPRTRPSQLDTEMGRAREIFDNIGRNIPQEEADSQLTGDFVIRELNFMRNWIERMLPTLKTGKFPRYTSWIWFREWLNNNSVFNHKKALFMENATFENRMLTFKHWPRWAKIQPSKLAQDGFVYLGYEDSVQCFCCAAVYGGWKSEDNVADEHAFFSPKCPFVALKYSHTYIRYVHMKRRLPQYVSIIESMKLELDIEAKRKENNAEEEKKEDKNLCIICLAYQISICFLPCAHTCVCVDCALSVDKCAICRVPIQASLKVYLP